MDAKRRSIFTYKQQGFIEFIPMIVLGIAAVSTFVILAMLGRNQDIRGRASEGVYPTIIAIPTITIKPTITPVLDCATCLRQNSPSECKVVCNVPIPTITTTATVAPTNTPANVITQADCTACLKTNTPSECSGVCQHIGQTYATPLGQQECSPGTSSCSGSTMKVCSDSGTWGVTTCQYGCENDACKPASSVTPTPAATATNCSTDGSYTADAKDCIGKMVCTGGGWVCVAPGTTPSTVGTYCDSVKCPYGCTSLSTTGGACKGTTIIPTVPTTPTTAPTTAPTPTPVPGYVPQGALCGGTFVTGDTCSQCQYGTSANLVGTKRCNAAPSPIPTPYSKTIGENCTNDSECGSGHCMTDVQFAAAHTGAPPAWNATTTCITAEVGQGLNTLAKGVAIGAGVAAAPVLIPAAVGVASSLSLIGVMATNALSTLPAWVSPALTGLGLAYPTVLTTKCLTHPDLCTEQDKMNIFLAGTSIQQLINEQAIQSLANQAVQTKQAAQTTTYALIGDPHADLPALKAELLRQGVIDDLGNPTGKPFIVQMDTFGKNTTVTGATGGTEVQNYILSLQNRISVSGNWDPQCVAGVCAYLRGDQATLDNLMNKTLSLEDIKLQAEDPAAFAAKLAQSNYVAILPGQSANVVAQHVDTAELARFALTPEDLAKLSQLDPQLAQTVANATSLSNTYAPLTAEQVTAINQATKALNLSTETITNNINTQAQAIVSTALANPADVTAGMFP